MLCPKTHFDMVNRMRPDFVAGLSTAAESYSDEKFAHIDDQIDNDHFLPLVKTELTRIAKAQLVRAGHPQSRVSALSYEQLIKTMDQRFAAQMFTAMRMEYLYISNFHAFGRKAFYFGPELTNKLADTELNMPSEMLVPPFPACMFVYDNQTARDALSLFFKMPSPLDGVVTVYLNHIARPDGRTKLVVFATMTDRKDSNLGAAVRGFLIDDNFSVEDALHTDWVKIDGGVRENLAPGYESAPTPTDERFYNDGLRIFRIIANSLLYLTSSSADLEPGFTPAQSDAPKAAASKELRRLTASTTGLQYVVVGRHATPYANEVKHQGRTLDQRFKVRGHWRNQAHGANFSLRKLIHVEPFWKGPEAADVINKPYSVR